MLYALEFDSEQNQDQRLTYRKGPSQEFTFTSEVKFKFETI